MSHALYVSQTGMTEPLAHSQVLPYLRGLVRHGWTFDLVALEPEGADPRAVEALQVSLATDGIHYAPGLRSASHSKASKVVQIAALVTSAVQLAIRNRPRIIHARSDVPAVAAVTVAKLVPGARSVFDCRGFLADEYADFGHWSRASLNYRGLRWSEERLYRNADAIVTLTENAKRYLVDETGWVRRETPFAVVPCCVDTERFRVSAETRRATRAALGLGDELVVTYAGTLGSWYCEEEMAALFTAISRRRPARFLVVTRASTERLTRALEDRGVTGERVIVRAAEPDQMAELLSVADVGISFARPAFSKRASSPVKMGEYLAAGAALVLNRGVGDVDLLLADRACFDAGDLSEAAIVHAAETIAATTFDEARRREAEAVAVREFDLEKLGIARYAALYRDLQS